MGIEERIHVMESSTKDLKSTFVLYGPEGVGKTTFLSFFEGLIIADSEDGRSSIMKTKNRPAIFSPNSIDDLAEFYVYLKANEEKYDAVAIDTFTEVQKQILLDVLAQECAKNPDKSPNLITQSDYGKGSTRMRKMARLFRNLDMYTFFICHEREDKDDSTGIVRKGPAVMPSVMKDLNAFCDFIFHMDVDNDGNRKLVTQPTKRVRAKHRIGDLPRVIELGESPNEMNINDILEMIEETTGEITVLK